MITFDLPSLPISPVSILSWEYTVFISLCWFTVQQYSLLEHPAYSTCQNWHLKVTRCNIISTLDDYWLTSSCLNEQLARRPYLIASVNLLRYLPWQRSRGGTLHAGYLSFCSLFCSAFCPISVYINRLFCRLIHREQAQFQAHCHRWSALIWKDEILLSKVLTLKRC